MNIDPEIKKQIEERRKEALRRLKANQERQQQQKSAQTSIGKLPVPQTSSSNRFSPYPPQNPSKPQSSDVLRSVNSNGPQSVNPVINNQVPRPTFHNNNPQASSSTTERRNPWAPVMRSNFPAQRPAPYQKPQQSNRPFSNQQNVPVRPALNHQQTVPQNMQPAAPPKKELKVTVEIINDHRFQVRTSDFDQDVINEMRKITSKSWSKILQF